MNMKRDSNYKESLLYQKNEFIKKFYETVTRASVEKFNIAMLQFEYNEKDVNIAKKYLENKFNMSITELTRRYFAQQSKEITDENDIIRLKKYMYRMRKPVLYVIDKIRLRSIINIEDCDYETFRYNTSPDYPLEWMFEYYHGANIVKQETQPIDIKLSINQLTKIGCTVNIRMYNENSLYIYTFI